MAAMRKAPNCSDIVVQALNSPTHPASTAFWSALSSSQASRLCTSQAAQHTMGGGNAQKSATARERKLKEAQKASKGSQLSSNAAAMSKKCNICLQTFVSTTQDAVLRQHWENKHPKLAVEACFPELKPAA